MQSHKVLTPLLVLVLQPPTKFSSMFQQPSTRFNGTMVGEESSKKSASQPSVEMKDNADSHSDALTLRIIPRMCEIESTVCTDIEMVWICKSNSVLCVVVVVKGAFVHG